jgi:hypothetical protein
MPAMSKLLSLVTSARSDQVIENVTLNRASLRESLTPHFPFREGVRLAHATPNIPITFPEIVF